MELKYSLPLSQEPGTGPYHKRNYSRPYLRTTCKIHLDIIPIYAQFFQVVSFFAIFRIQFSLPDLSYVPYTHCLNILHWLRGPNNILWWVQIRDFSAQNYLQKQAPWSALIRLNLQGHDLLFSSLWTWMYLCPDGDDGRSERIYARINKFQVLIENYMPKHDRLCEQVLKLDQES